MLNLRRGWCQPGTAGIYPSDVTTHGVVSGNSACRRLQADQAWAGCVLPCGLLGGLQRDFRCARWQASYLSEINSDPEGSAMKRVCSAVCCVVLCSIPALAQKKGMTDQQFVDFAAQTDMVEANLGQLAGNVGDSQAVKDYGQMLTTDHTKDYGQLSAAAQQASLNVPNAIDKEHNKMMIDPFQKLKGAAFDHKFAAEMVAGHTKAIAVYKKEADDAQNPALKSYAQAALPTLQQHLDQAKSLEKGK
jgi:putative membrane protein